MAYDLEIAYRLAVLSSAAYLNGFDAEREALAFGADEAHAIDVGNVEFLIARFGADVAIVFRGTSEGDDVLRDAWASLEARDGFLGRVHAGLSLGPFEASQAILSEVREMLGLDGFVDVGGHSKGGAEAIFAAWLLKARDIPIRSVHVFGCPAVGDREFVYELTATLPEVYSHVYRSDIVARAPMLLRALGLYWPAGRLVFHTRFRSRFRVSWWRWLLHSLRALTRFRAKADHSMSNYVFATFRRSVSQ